MATTLGELCTCNAKAAANPLLSLSDKELVDRLCPPTTLEAWTFTARDIREALQGKRVLCPSIELSNACNLNCPYCYVEHATSLKKREYADQLTVGELEDLVKQLADAGAKTVNIIGAGEPTVDPAFVKIVRLIASLGMRPLVATNGIKVATSSHTLAAIVETSASVVLKCNSRNSKLQDILVGNKGYAVLRDKAFELLLNAGLNKTRPTRLAFNSLQMRANLGEALELHEFCRRNNIALVSGDYMPTGRTRGGQFRGELVLEHQENMCDATKEMFEPLEPSQRALLASMMASTDDKLGFPVLPVVAYVSGIPCVQALGVCVDNHGQVWDCPARQQVINDRIAKQDLRQPHRLNIFLDLWRHHQYLQFIRHTFDGGCRYKAPVLIRVHSGETQ
jgi:molybdenum cofactor biosynthesis enzyme MoaA